MANVAALDIDMSAVDFRAAHAELVRLKRDRNGARPTTDAWRRAIAEWANWVDDVALALQSRSQDHETRVAALEAGTGLTLDAVTDTHIVVRSGADLGDSGYTATDIADIITGIQDIVATPGDVVAVAAPVTVGAANDPGTSSALARADHVHAAGSIADVTDYVVRTCTFANDATVVFANGVGVVLGGVTWIPQNVTAATIFRNAVASGIQWTAPTSGATTAMTESTQTAAYLYTTLGDLVGSSFRPWHRYVIEVHLSSSTFENNTEACYVFAWSPTASPTGSNQRMRGCGIGNNAGTRGMRVIQSTTVSGGVAAPTETVFALELSSASYGGAFLGTYSGGFPTAYEQGASMTADPSGAAEPFMRTDTRIGFAFVQSLDATPTTAAVIPRMQVRRVA